MLRQLVESLAAAQKERDEKHAAEISQLKESAEKQASLLAALTATRSLASPSTPSQLGYQHTEALLAIGSVRVLAPGEGPPILTEQQQADLSALADAGGGAAEAAIVRYMAPHLRLLRQHGTGEAGAVAPLVMLNSESHAWLVHPAVEGVQSQRLKPDLFLTWVPFVDVRGEAEGFPHGVLASPSLQKAGCVAELYEAKSKPLSTETFGKQCLYHQCIPGRFKSALFNQSQCWLLETMHGSPLRLLQMNWTTPGSKRELQLFMGAPAAPPLLLLLRRVLAELQLTTLSPSGRCHLGSGASGHVFAVHRTSDAARTPLALKLVLGVQEGGLHAEFVRMQAAAAAGAPVVAPVPNSLCIFSSSAAAASVAASAEAPAPACASGGYLLSLVGARFDATTFGGMKEAFSALSALHKCSVFHGDARTANLLDFEGRAMWIDLRTGIVDESGAASLPLEQQRYDAAVLARSMLPHLQLLPTTVQAALGLYDAAAPGTVGGLAKAVWGAS